ncbi:acetyl-CoA synthetase-like protein, partial [Aureobasidium melanogenum]
MGDIMQRTDLKKLVPQPKPYKKGPYSVEAKGYEKKDGETIPRVHPLAKDGLISTPAPDIKTIYDILRSSSKKFGNAKALGYRNLIKVHDEVKQIKKVVDGKETTTDKTWQYSELSPYTYLSFVEYEQLCFKLGSGYRALGMNKGDRIHIFASTSPWWLATAYAASSQSMPIVTAYDTLGEEGLMHSLKQTHAKLIFLDPHLLTKLIKPLEETKDIQYVVYNSHMEVKKEDIEKLKNAHPHLTILSFDELTKKGEENMVEPVPPQPEDLCCIMYTSGSTGAPKGVLLKHKNVLAAIAGVDAIVGPYIGPGDGLLAYLPLAHILEFVFESACFYWGGTMGYGNPRTISDASVRNCAGDIREFKPSVLIGVPAVWETVKKGIVSKVDKTGGIAKQLFWAGMAAKSTMMHHSSLPFTGLGTSVMDSVIFSKIKEATGGKLRICMNGGGPIAKDTQRFISMAIAPLISGYGLTETAAMGVIMDPLAWTDEALGGLPASIEVKLVDFPDAGYYSTNNPPQGEIWIRGDSVTDGYLDLEKENKESFEDGWFKSGDIGEFDKNGNLKIIDRKKNLVKTLNGEYIALEKLESIYRATQVVGNICVYADQSKNKPIAIIVPAEPALKSLASDIGCKSDDLEEMCHDKKLNEAVLKNLQATGKKGGLAGIEIIEGVVLAPDEWTPQNQLVTSAQKLNRKNILEKYKKEVDQAYGSS